MLINANLKSYLVQLICECVTFVHTKFSSQAVRYNLTVTSHETRFGISFLSKLFKFTLLLMTAHQYYPGLQKCHLPWASFLL